MARRRTAVAVLGATGSVGRQTLEVCAELDLPVVALAARQLSAELMDLAERHRPAVVATTAPSPAHAIHLPKGCRLICGPDALRQVALLPAVQRVVVAVLGLAGLAPTLAALRAGKVVALATKEVLVAGGELVSRAARHGQLLTVDSEHAALFQLLGGKPWRPGQTLWLTASGGALRDWPEGALATASREDVLRHPTWSMGDKITVDSANLMNKGLEVIEAHHLFGAPYSSIRVAVQRDSYAHGAIGLADGSLLLQVAAPDMRLPIARALTWPDEPPGRAQALALPELPSIHFEAVSESRYPALQLAYSVGTMGSLAPALLSSANDAAVAMFLGGRIGFDQIVPLVATTVADGDAWRQVRLTLANLKAADRWAKRRVGELAGGGASH
ncbi:MAG: 1-deoxy-D-xylulose-5-phosphate reductoisomerase [Sulfobacillus sp.]